MEDWKSKTNLMRSNDLVLRGLSHYWRTNVAVVLGVATAVAVLAGALIVGDSVRGSLRDLVLQRLGRTDRAVLASTFFREALAADLEADPAFAASFEAAAPIIAVEGMVSEQATRRRALRVHVYGVDDRFWRFHGRPQVSGPHARDALLSRTLAADLGAAAGSTVLVRVERPSAVPLESLHGRKDAPGRTLRLAVRAILGPEDMGDFSLRPAQGEVRAVFVPLERLQQDLEVVERVNTVLVADGQGATNRGLEEAIRRRFALEDVDLTVRAVAAPAVLAVESPAGLIDRPRAAAVEAAAAASAMRAQPILTYLANAMRSGDREIPYSLVTATDLRAIAPPGATPPASSVPPIVVNDWAARDLRVAVGDPLTLDYYVWEEPGRLVTRSSDFRIAAIVPIAGAAADRDLAPVYPGITEAKTVGDWNPPFPIDLRRVRRVDEDYWDTYRTTPKAFIPLEVGQQLWQSRYGDRTSVRLALAPGLAESAAREEYAGRLRGGIDPLAMGLSIQEARTEGLAASRGATDFGEYFTYFSFFLVISALMLSALFFRLGVEQRAREVGLLRAVGFTTARVRRLFFAEGFVLAATGSVLGVAGAVAYGAVMMTGLRTWWSGAVGTDALGLHVSPVSLAAGAAGALAAAMGCIWWTLRSLTRLSERSLLSGDRIGDRADPLQSRAASRTSPRHLLKPCSGEMKQVSGEALESVLAAAQRPPSNEDSLPAARSSLGGLRRSFVTTPSVVAAIVFGIAGAALLAASLQGAIDRTGAFFGAGTSLLIACLCAVAASLRRRKRSSIGGHGWRPVWRLGLRNAADRPGRSVLAIGVIASATFILIAVEAFRREGPSPTDRHSGVGGYPLLIDLMLPIVDDPNSRDGHDALGLADGEQIQIEPFRVRPGDDASCLNLYEPRNPRVLGAGQRFIDAGRFAFQQSLAADEAERANPWRLLNRRMDPDVVPVIADANSLTYVLHKSLGDDIVLTIGDRAVRLRVVAALADSIFQGELVMSDAHFVALFPEHEGYRFLLVDAPADRVAPLAAAIEEGGADLGADAVPTSERLAEFHTVENTYLSTFQALGGLGLLVGTVGLAAVVLRNVMERRRELALLGAVGYRRAHIFAIVVAENLFLLGWGLVIGTVCALIAIAPALSERGGRLPAGGDGLVLVAVCAAGLLSSLVATRAALRAPLLNALRSE